MRSRSIRPFLMSCALGLTVLAAPGCSKIKSVIAPNANARPTIELTRAPFNESTRFEYSYRMNWIGNDPDGRVEYYLYAVDPPAPTSANPEPDTAWVITTKSERLVNFSATKPDNSDPTKNGSSDFHTFVVKAIDNGGLGGPLQSAPLVRSFFTYTIAPTVQIIDPTPSDRSRSYVTPSVRISWRGTDEDGILDNKKPVKYKYILLTGNTAVPFQVALTNPDSVRRYYAPRNWAGWDSTSADTTTKQFTNLVPSQDYMFCVVAFDEAGAYSPIFTQNNSMLNMRVTFAVTGGPALTVFNEIFFYEYNPPVYSLLPQYQIKVEIPADELVTFNWFGVAGPGADVRGYRWALDIDDVSDQTPRTPNERVDVRHWSQLSALSTSATVGPFGGGETHLFYIEAEDNNGLKSLGVVNFTVVRSSLEKPLLIVKDTRLPVDQKRPTDTCMQPPGSTRWPISAELDTFLFARGGKAYKCYPTGTISSPGLFAGYQFDTLGTRFGLSETRVPLAKIGQYAHVIWLTDQGGAFNARSGTDIANSITAMRYMNERGRANSIAAYIKQGGEVWLAGGGVATASLLPYNKLNNDTAAPAAGTTFSNTNNELIPGRFMYDITHWQSEIKLGYYPIAVTRNRGRFEYGPGPSEYNSLPAQMRPKSASLGDAYPANRTVIAGNFYVTNFEVEYLSLQNRILEDIDPSLLVFNEQSTLDTLYKATGPNLIQYPVPAPGFIQGINPCMTRYTGPAYTHIIFTGFNFWTFTRVDCKALVDGVLKGFWNLPYTGPAPAQLQSSSPPMPAAVTQIKWTASAAPVRAPGGVARAATGDR